MGPRRRWLRGRMARTCAVALTALAALAAVADTAGRAADDPAPKTAKTKSAKSDPAVDDEGRPLDPDAVHAYDFDRVKLVGGNAFWGKVQQPVGPDGWQILLQDPKTEDPGERERQGNSRVVVLPAWRVADIGWNFPERVKKLRDDRDAGRLDDAAYHRALAALADFAHRHRAARPEYHDQARQLLNELIDAPEAPADVRLRLGRLYDERDPATDESRRRALEHYEAHLARFPDDAEAAAAVERLRAILAPPEAAAVEAPEAPPPAAARPEGLEAQTNWSWMLDGINPDADMRRTLQPAVVFNAGDNNNKMLCLPYMPAGKDKLIYQLPSAQREGRDFDGNESMVFTAYLPPDTPGVRLAVALSTGNYQWFESRALPLPKADRWEPKTFRFSLKDNSWKSESTNWRHETAVQNLNRVRTVHVLIYGIQGRGEVLLDDFRFE